MVLAAGNGASPDARAALEKLCRTYWYPLYAFVRRLGRSPEEAQDLTQGFFTRLLEKEYISFAEPTRGRCRTFLLSSLKAFIAEAHRHATCLKRGGGQVFVPRDDLTGERRYLAEPSHESTAEALYEERWALTLLETALERLGAQLASVGKTQLFAELRDHLTGEPDAASYAAISERVGLSEGNRLFPEPPDL